MQTAIPYMQFRGGSSKGLYFKATDLPADEELRDKLIIAAMEGLGQGDPRQIDGLGGGTSLTSKAAVVSLSTSHTAQLDYLFLQVIIGKGKVSTTQTCGNILAGVVHFAIECGLIKATSPTTSAKVNLVNTGGICEVTIETPFGKVNYEGDTKVDGVPGTSAPVICHYIGTCGATCGSLLPTGNLKDIVNGIPVTCIDNGMPQVIIKASDLGIKGNETPTYLNNNEYLKKTLEGIRLQIGKAMNLGDVTHKTIPKMCIVSPPLHGGTIHTRTFIPHVCHEAIGVLGAVSIATACMLKGTVVDNVCEVANTQTLSIEHPMGEFTVVLNLTNYDGNITINKSGVVRTARLISKGEVYIPSYPKKNTNNAPHL
ncbi:MAG: 4-oxalomesaconate tautomerase [Bacteroidetes bacterium]|nr:MAG: 4-oxalomesaconate tautomerase [Bacteroidota bacterium]